MNFYKKIFSKKKLGCAECEGTGWVGGIRPGIGNNPILCDCGNEIEKRALALSELSKAQKILEQNFDSLEVELDGSNNDVRELVAAAREILDETHEPEVLNDGTVLYPEAPCAERSTRDALQKALAKFEGMK